MRSRLTVSAALLLAAIPLAAGAQLASPAPQTIVVDGLGGAGGPVSGAIIVALVRGGGTDLPGLQAALSKVGIVEVVADNTFLSHNGLAVGIRGRLPVLSVAAVATATDAVRSYVQAHRGASVVRIVFQGLAVDCPPIAASARTAALADARARADAIAQGNGRHLGSVVSVTEHGGCPPGGRLGSAGYAIDPQTLTMSVSIKESVIYAMAP